MNCTLNKIVNLYKPTGPSSFNMVRSVKKILGVKKAGHIGTLDPLAEGVLPICLNRSTRIIQFLASQEKVYKAGMELGTSTDTQDSTGKPLDTADASKITEEDILSVFKDFLGEIQQVPPMYSAKKKNGIPLYKLARNGITIDRKPVTLWVHSLDFIKKEGNRVHFEVRCSPGTYVRTLCHDIGEKLGCRAHMFRLVRTRVGVFDVESSITLDALKTAKEENNLSGKLFHPGKALDFLPAVRVKKEHIQSIAHGIALSKSSLETLPSQFKPGMLFRVSNEDHPVAAIVEPVIDQSTFAQLEPGDTVFKLKRVLI
ncbi:MAG: tRNA pseudouridine(55) synthase TruB [Nitrospinaceae bacterium]